MKRRRRPSALSREYLRRYREQFGNVCPGYARAGHPSDDLTVDHIIPVSKGGRDAWANFRVLCRGCNSAKHDLRVEFPPKMKSFPNPMG